jgi:hypothetical protein
MTYRVVVSRFGQSAPVFTTAPSTILGPRIPNEILPHAHDLSLGNTPWPT